MNVDDRNLLLFQGSLDRDDLWPKVKDYENQRFQFRWEFGLNELPPDPGLITIRGARQIGKSTWLELQLLDTLEEHGKGTGYFLNGDSIYSHSEFESKLLEVEALFGKKKIKRLFIDEITQIPEWERVIKRLVDAGHLRDVLIVTTGSNAADLRHGSERLPGRKGNLPRSEYVFLPISYREFRYQVKDEMGTFSSDSLFAYILSGGSPMAARSLFYDEKLDENFISLITDWILGSLASSGRSRTFLLNILRRLYQVAPGSLSYTKLAKEAGLANNTAALDYVERLADLLCVYPMMQWDSQKNLPLAKKPSKFPFINLAAAWAFHPQAPRYLHEIKQLEGREKGAMHEWVVAQELWRRGQLALQSESKRTIDSLYEVELRYWASKNHEIDFVTSTGEFFEVKAGATQPTEFLWFPKTFPQKRLNVVSESPWETEWGASVRLEEFLMSAPSHLYYDEDRAPWNEK